MHKNLFIRVHVIMKEGKKLTFTPCRRIFQITICRREQLETDTGHTTKSSSNAESVVVVVHQVYRAI